MAPPVPPLTTARPAGETAPSASAFVAAGAAASDAPVAASPPTVTVVDVPSEVAVEPCDRVLFAVASGSVRVLGETLAAGDVLDVEPTADKVKLESSGRVVVARIADPGHRCAVQKRKLEHQVVRANAAPKLEWASGTMRARLDHSTGQVYVGRLEGTAAVAEHAHEGSWEILVALEANGTFSLGGKEARLAARQVVVVPPGTKHAWKPDPGSKLVAVQLYSPPGPEQRFVALAAAEKDAGASAPVAK